MAIARRYGTSSAMVAISVLLALVPSGAALVGTTEPTRFGIELTPHRISMNPRDVAAVMAALRSPE